MRNLEIYKDMREDTTNHQIYLKKVAIYIDRVRNYIPPDLLGELNRYRLTLDEFSLKFYDWDTNKFKREEFENYIDTFCIRIETIEMMKTMIGNKEENK